MVYGRRERRAEHRVGEIVPQCPAHYGSGVAPDTKLSASAGEHYVCSMLARAGWAASLTRDGPARTDILAVQSSAERHIESARIGSEVWDRYADRWDLLDEPAEAAPVMLPAWMRDRIETAGVGLPPDHPWHVEIPEFE